MNITWKYTNFNVYNEYDGQPNVVYSYKYECIVSDGQSSASESGMIRLVLGHLANFVQYQNLTQEIVQSWTEATIDTQSIVNKLQERVIAKSASTIHSLPPPWESVQ